MTPGEKARMRALERKVEDLLKQIKRLESEKAQLNQRISEAVRARGQR